MMQFFDLVLMSQAMTLATNIFLCITGAYMLYQLVLHRKEDTGDVTGLSGLGALEDSSSTSDNSKAPCKLPGLSKLAGVAKLDLVDSDKD